MFIKIFRYHITWVLLAVLVSTSVLQIHYLNRALMAFEGKVRGRMIAFDFVVQVLTVIYGEQQVIPTQFVFFSISGKCVEGCETVLSSEDSVRLQPS